MNCKPGDLAVIVRPDSPNYGRFVTVVAPYDGRLSAQGLPFSAVPDWIAEGHGLVASRGGVVIGPTPWVGARDKSLRPIRDNDGEDEMLRIVGKPHEEPNHA